MRVTSRQGGIVFYLTPAGRRRAGQLDLSNAALAGGPVEQHALDWTGRVLQVLEAVERIYSPGHSPMGVRTEEVAAELGADAQSSGAQLAGGRHDRVGTRTVAPRRRDAPQGERGR